jgi:hypothetical protein
VGLTLSMPRPNHHPPEIYRRCMDFPYSCLAFELCFSAEVYAAATTRPPKFKREPTEEHYNNLPSTCYHWPGEASRTANPANC